MPLRGGLPGALWPVVLAPLGMALWVLSAYLASPLLLPLLAAAAALVVVTIRWPEIGIAAVLVLTPLQDLRVGSGAGTALQPLQAVIPSLAIGLLVYTAVGRRSLERDSPARAVTGALVLFLAVSIASALQAIEPQDSINKLVLLCAAVAIYAAVRLGCRDRRQVLIVVAGAVAGLLVTSLYALVQSTLGLGKVYTFTAGGEIVGRATAAFEHPAGLGYYIAVVAPLAAALALTRETPRALRGLAAAAAVLAVPALVLAYSRSAILAVLAAPVVWFCMVRPRRAPAAVAAAAALALVLLLLAPASLRDRFDPQRGSRDVELRANVWGAGFDIYSQHPLLGAGINNFPNAYATLPNTPANTFRRAIPAAGSRVTPSNAHDGYLNTLAEQGLVGLASLLLLMAAAASVIYRASFLSDPISRRVALGIGVGATGWALVNLTDTSVITETTTVSFALIAGLARLVELDSA